MLSTEFPLTNTNTSTQVEDIAAPNSDLITLDGTTIVVAFAEHFSRPGLAHFERFPLHRKRNFALMAPRCVESMQIAAQDADFVFGLLSLRSALMTPHDHPGAVTEENLPQHIADLFSPATAELIRNHVNAIYDEREINIDTAHRGNEELQFTNEHARLVLQWSFACLVAAPVIVTFMDVHELRSGDTLTLFMDCFCALLTKIVPAEAEIDLLAKLKKLTTSRVCQTQYTDRVIWSYLEAFSTTPTAFSTWLLRKLVTEGVPKLAQGTNIMLFLQTFLKNQLNFQFTSKFTMVMRPVRQDVMDGEGQGGMRHIETELSRRDESTAIIVDAACQQAYAEVCNEIGWQPADDEVDYWCALLRAEGVTSWQRGMVTKFFLPRIGSVAGIRSRTMRDYVRMVLVTHRWLNQNGFDILADFMLAKVHEGSDVRRLTARRKFVREFVSSAAYQELLATHFSTTTQAVVDSNVIMTMIGEVSTGTFEKFPPFSATPPATPARREEITHTIEASAQQIVVFIATMCSA